MKSKHDFLEDQLIILTKQTLDAFLQSDKPGDLIALYSFYYYTAKWQETDQPKCTTAYAAKGLKWGEQRVREAKKELISLGLIEDVAEKDDGNKIKGHYVRISYLFSRNSEQKNENFHPCSFPQCGNSHRVEIRETNALSTNIENALSDNKEMLTEAFSRFWTVYPNKAAKGKAREAFEKVLASGVTVDTLIAAVRLQCRSEQWSKENGKYIPYPSTWLNQGRWEDELKLSEDEPIIFHAPD